MKKRNSFFATFAAMLMTLALLSTAFGMKIAFADDAWRVSEEIPMLMTQEEIDDSEQGDVGFDEPDIDAPPIFDDIENAGVYLREQMKLREETIVLGFINPPQDFKDALYEVAFRHTGVADEGDYLYWQKYTIGFTSSDGSDGVVYFTFKVTYYSTYEQELAVSSRINELFGEWGIDEMDDYHKVRAIYFYIVQNVDYNFAATGGTDVTARSAYSALIEGDAVCQGYAALFYRMALEAGVDARFIKGTISTSPSNLLAGHGWNIVELDGAYYSVDATRDSFNSFPFSWFLIGSETFYGEDGYVWSDDYARQYGRYNLSVNDYPRDDGDFIYWQVEGDLMWSYSEQTHTLAISGNGAMSDYTVSLSGAAPWYNYPFTSVVIEDGVTYIGENAFCGASSLAHVSIADSVTSIGKQAFYKCPNLLEVAVPGSVAEIGERAFGYYIEKVDGVNTNVKVDGFTITCDNMTAAEEYARSRGFDFSSPTTELEEPILDDSAVTRNSFTLTWTPAENADGFANSGYRAGCRQLWRAIASVTGCSYTHATLKAGSFFNFGIQAFLRELESDLSETRDGGFKLAQMIEVPSHARTVTLGSSISLGAKMKGDGALTYKSGNTTIATVDANGVVTGKTTGTVVIVISAGGSDSCKRAAKYVTVTVKAGQTVISSDKSVAVGSAVSLRAKASDGGILTYKSSNTAVATVNSTGVVTGRKTGTVTITIVAAETDTHARAVTTVTVTVKGKQTITASNMSVAVGSAVSLGAQVDSGVSLRYESSDPTIAVVSSTGIVTGKKAGTVTITIRAPETSRWKFTSRNVTVTVKNPNAVTAKAKSPSVFVTYGTVSIRACLVPASHRARTGSRTMLTKLSW